MRIILNGAQGAMGRELQRILPAAGHEIVAKVDVNGGAYTSMAQVQVPADMVVDFSFHTATAGAVDYALAHNLPIVVGTTGHTEQERAHILLAGEKIPVFYSGNMSLGIAVLCNLVREAVRIFPQADVEILEIHHNRKADAPSGTALMLARAVQSVRPDAVVHCGRAGVGGRLPREIGVASLRMGNIVGIHEVLISTGNETITLKHEAHDRALLAQGAAEAAAVLQDKGPGVYGMEELVSK